MKLATIRTTVITAALSAALALTACSNDDNRAAGPMGHSSGSPSGDFNQADVTFIQGMIPHHQQAIDMSDLVLAKEGIHPEVTALAEQIKAAQQPEIDTMIRWLSAWGRDMDAGVGDGGGHHGGEGGIMTEEQMRQLDKADPSEGQRLYLEGMIRHHQGAIQMAETELADGKNIEAINIAKHIAESQQQEIETMQALLTKI